MKFEETSKVRRGNETHVQYSTVGVEVRDMLPIFYIPNGQSFTYSKASVLQLTPALVLVILVIMIIVILKGISEGLDRTWDIED